MRAVFLLLLLLPLPLSVHAEDLGELSANPFNPESTANLFGAGSPFKPDGLGEIKVSGAIFYRSYSTSSPEKSSMTSNPPSNSSG